jgi:hypothetical protein
MQEMTPPDVKKIMARLRKMRRYLPRSVYVLGGGFVISRFSGGAVSG